jgi:phage shock protein PspC (stress-responsive transcriptional regulator)
MNKKIYKSSTDKALFGVCGGIAEYFEVDPVIIRLLMALFGLTGAGVVFYIFAAAVMREKPDIYYDRRAAGASYGAGGAETYDGGFPGGEAAGSRPSRTERPRAGGKGAGVVIIGLVLIMIGLFYLLNLFVPIFRWIDMRAVFAALLVLAGIYFVAKR